VLQKHFNRQAQVTAREALSGLQVLPFGGLRYAYRHPQLRKEGCPQGLVVKIEEPTGDAYHRSG